MTSVLGLASGDKTAIIGCGGKTSLMYALASENRGKAVMITTTTRIFPPPAHVYDFVMGRQAAGIKKGVSLLYGKEKDGKLLPPPENELSHAQGLFDCVFIEADGSKTLPLKGWTDYEPVIPDFVTATAGVASVSPVGEALSRNNTHRLQLFTGLTGCSAGDAVSTAHIAAMISHPRGMFQRAKGKKILFINQVEDETARKHAFEVLNNMPKDFLKSLYRIVIGSLFQSSYEIVLENSPQ